MLNRQVEEELVLVVDDDDDDDAIVGRLLWIEDELENADADGTKLNSNAVAAAAAAKPPSDDTILKDVTENIIISYIVYYSHKVVSVVGRYNSPRR